MEDKSALVTVAMLSAQLNEQHTDYLDIISPFVLDLLPQTVGSVVDTNEIIKGLENNYGFAEFPIHVLIKILTRFAKIKFGYLEKKNGHFLVKKNVSTNAFRESQERIRAAQESVMTELQTYLRKHSKYTKITVDETREKFLSFLERKGLAFVDGIDSLRDVTSRDYDIFQVARFVLDEHSKKSSVFHQIEEVVRGFFVYKSIYFYSKESVVSLTTKVRRTVFYFDTPLLIELLGYNSNEGKAASLELMQLITACGGQVRTFSHLVNEVDGILAAFACKKDRRSSFNLQYLVENNYNTCDIGRLRTTLKLTLEEMGIVIDDPVDFIEYASDEYAPLEINDLSYEIQVVYKQETPSNRLDNDVKSVISIYKKRGSAKSLALDDCRAVLVTSNLGFVRAVSSFYKDKNSHEVDYVVSDIDIASILWLQTWDKKGSLPSIILLENAYAACQPTNDLIKAFEESIEKLRQEGGISDDAALLLRTQRVPREYLMEEAQNDPSLVSEETVVKVKEKYEASIVKDKNNEIEQLQYLNKSQKEKDEKKFNSAKERALCKAEQTAKNAAKKTKKRWTAAFGVLFAVLILIGVGVICYQQFSSTSSETGNVAIMLITNAFLALVGVLGYIDLLKSSTGYIAKFIMREKSKRFAAVHCREMESVKKVFGDE